MKMSQNLQKIHLKKEQKYLGHTVMSEHNRIVALVILQGQQTRFLGQVVCVTNDVSRYVWFSHDLLLAEHTVKYPSEIRDASLLKEKVISCQKHNDKFPCNIDFEETNS